jgi:pilus assembly protein CpaB
MFLMVGGLITLYVGKVLFATEDATTIEMTSVPMAVVQLAPGTKVTPAHLGIGRIQANERIPEMLLSDEGILGRVVKETIPAATPIMSRQLYRPGEGPPLDLGTGMRAVSVSVGESVAMVNGHVKPGQFVDIHLTPSATDARFRGGLTLTLFQGVKVLAINRSTQPASVERIGNAVTLELSPQQANIMILARERGEITLSFNPEGRGSGGVTVGSEDRVTLEEILGLKPLPQSAPPFTVESFKGSNRTKLQFRNGKRIDGNASGIPQDGN